MKTQPESISPANRTEWRTWLAEHHNKQESIWVIFYKKVSADHNMTWSDAVDEALCFGWVDSTRRPVDEEKFIQFFSRRKPSSTWSKINKEKVERLTAEGLMTEAGVRCIEIAKKNGNWTILDSVDALEIPADLEKAFSKFPNASEYFNGLSKSMKKMCLQWLVLAKTDATRARRISEIAMEASNQTVPNQFRPVKRK